IHKGQGQGISPPEFYKACPKAMRGIWQNDLGEYFVALFCGSPLADKKILRRHAPGAVDRLENKKTVVNQKRRRAVKAGYGGANIAAYGRQVSGLHGAYAAGRRAKVRIIHDAEWVVDDLLECACGSDLQMVPDPGDPVQIQTRDIQKVIRGNRARPPCGDDIRASCKNHNLLILICRKHRGRFTQIGGLKQFKPFHIVTFKRFLYPPMGSAG
ncbi:MAG TPA: hypothetical protein P5281_04685, partial [Anaerovoracaceae bacterium]|nr:hypothetical protein [Anaerovoracaceae bacterium]